MARAQRLSKSRVRLMLNLVSWSEAGQIRRCARQGKRANYDDRKVLRLSVNVLRGENEVLLR